MISDQLASCVTIAGEIGIGGTDDRVELLDRGMEHACIFINRVDLGVVPLGVLANKVLQPAFAESSRGSDTGSVGAAGRGCVSKIGGGARWVVRTGQPSLVVDPVPEEIPVGFTWSSPGEVSDVGRCLADRDLFASRGAIDDLSNHGERIKRTSLSVADEPISDTIEGVTGSDNGLCERVHLAFRREVTLDLHHYLRP